MDTTLTSLFSERASVAGASAPVSGSGSNRGSSAADFAKVLGRWSSEKDASPEQKAREAAEELVAVTFVQPVLKQLRETNQAAEPFAPSDGEKQFRSMHDAVLAQRIVKASGFALVERLATDLLKKGQEVTNVSPIEVRA